ncbi:MAG TPA: YheV family putative zinc ribbon protein [Pseudomonadales bacterium]|nr:YheV family putative zinc ribbon protein [Pseudomonadales bacterium]
MSQLPDTPKRFVAGAKCPQCQMVDKVVMFRKDGIQYQACVSCGYQDEMAFERSFRELETRVNRTADEKLDEVAVVRLIDPTQND